MRFTDAKIKALKPKKERYEVSDGGSFRLRLFPSGVKSWIFLYRFEGRQRRLTLGTYPVLSLAGARVLHSDAVLKVERGVDPGAEQAEKKRQAVLEPTMDDLCNEYMERHSKPNKATWKEDQRIIDKRILPKFGRRKVISLKRREIVHFLDGIVEEGSPVMANHVHTLLTGIFNFGVRRDAITASPYAGASKPAKEKPRDRELTDEEIKCLWDGLDEASMSAEVKAAIKLLILTGQRRGEAMKTEWQHIDFKGGWWTIPAANAKTGNAHRVPLTPLACKVLQSLREKTGNNQFLFPAPSKKTHMKPVAATVAFNRNKTKLYPEYETEPVTTYSLHDLRHTVISRLAASGILPHVVSRVVNHTLSSSTTERVYNHYAYDKEKRQALETWERKLQEIVFGKKSMAKVVTLTR